MTKRAYIKQAAEELGLTEYQLRRMAKEGKIPYLKSGVKYIFDIEQCVEFLKNEAMKNVKSKEDNIQYGVLRKVNA